MDLIVAVDQNWAIGFHGNLLAYLNEDLKRFRSLTYNRTVILGRKTLATFPNGLPLKNRRNLILSSSPNFHVNHAEVFPSLELLLAAAPDNSFVIGGASVYQALLPLCSTAFVTKIHAAFPADSWFPNLDSLPNWSLADESSPLVQDGLVYHFATYHAL